MATIYGTPVILLKKPDTSEQWIINVEPDITSILPSGGSKTLSVSFTSNNTSYTEFNFASD